MCSPFLWRQEGLWVCFLVYITFSSLIVTFQKINLFFCSPFLCRQEGLWVCIFVLFFRISSLIVAFRKISWFICSPFLCRQERTKEARPTSFSANSCFGFSKMEKALFQEFRSNSWDIYVKGKVSHNYPLSYIYSS